MQHGSISLQRAVRASSVKSRKPKNRLQGVEAAGPLRTLLTRAETHGPYRGEVAVLVPPMYFGPSFRRAYERDRCAYVRYEYSFPTPSHSFPSPHLSLREGTRDS